MTGITEPSGEKVATFYWPDNVRFLVEGCLFRVPQYPFIAGSEYFAQKYGLYSSDNDTSPPDTVHLEGAAAKEFRIFLRALFPSLSSDSATISFTKREWLCILKLSTLWQFKDLRSLAIKHLEGQLDEIELVQNGRAAYVPRWVATGYRWMVERPAQQVITADEAEVIGNATVNHLWIVRWTRAHSSPSTVAVVQDIRSTFEHELATLEERDREFRTKKEIEEEERALEEERAAVEEEERRRAARRAATEALERAEQRRLEEARLAEEVASSTVASACEQQSQEEHQQVSVVPSIDSEQPPQYPPSMEPTELVEASTTTILVSNGAEVEEANGPVTDAQKKKKRKKITCEVCSTKFIREKGQKKTKMCGACTAFAQLTMPVG